MRRPVGVAFQRDRRHAYDRRFGEPLLQIVVFRLALSQPEPPAVIMDHDADMVRIVERCRTAVERRVIELPSRRSDLPDELGKIVPVFVVALPSAFRGEVVLIPPLELGLGRQRYLAGFLAADQVAAYGDEGIAALRPERGDDFGGPCSPIIARDRRPLDLESIHQGEDVESDDRLLAVSESLAAEKARGAVA